MEGLAYILLGTVFGPGSSKADEINMYWNSSDFDGAKDPCPLYCPGHLLPSTAVDRLLVLGLIRDGYFYDRIFVNFIVSRVSLTEGTFFDAVT